MRITKTAGANSISGNRPELFLDHARTTDARKTVPNVAALEEMQHMSARKTGFVLRFQSWLQPRILDIRLTAARLTRSAGGTADASTCPIQTAWCRSFAVKLI